jgi:NAD(P)-dependent dehydrogenase (short-subunit alcohol dehydrogenase family)
MTASAALAGKHAVVTGASRGIGAVIATALAGAGARVSLLARDGRSLATVAERLGQGVALALAADVTDGDSVRSALAAARRTFGPVSVLINNAGQAASAKFTDTDEALWNRIVAVNLTGPYLCTRECVPDMLGLNFGRIVNIASVAGLQGAPYISAYASSKHALVGLTRSLALEYATRNLTVNAVCPGYADTEMVRSAVANIGRRTGRTESEALAALVANNPQGRLIRPEEIAHAVMWLCSPGAESITGQCIVLSGGAVH